MEETKHKHLPWLLIVIVLLLMGAVLVQMLWLKKDTLDPVQPVVEQVSPDVTDTFLAEPTLSEAEASTFNAQAAVYTQEPTMTPDEQAAFEAKAAALLES